MSLPEHCLGYRRYLLHVSSGECESGGQGEGDNDSHYDLDKNRFGGMARVRPGLNGSVKECKVEMEKC